MNQAENNHAWKEWWHTHAWIQNLIPLDVRLRVRRSMPTMFVVLGSLCIAAFFYPAWEGQYDADTQRSLQRLEFGLPMSPWYAYHNEETRGVGAHMSMGFIGPSWSWFVLIVGVGLIKCGSRLRKGRRNLTAAEQQ